MPCCFAACCNHHSSRSDCKLYRVPEGKRKAWEQLCRRADRRITASDRICSCHFEDGNKSKGPTIFAWSKTISPIARHESRCRKRAQSFDKTTHTTTHEQLEEDPSTSAQEVNCTRAQNLDNTSHTTTHAHLAEAPSTSAQGVNSDNGTRTATPPRTGMATGRKPFSITDIKDVPEKMLLYTSLPIDSFQFIVDELQEYAPLTYYFGWSVSTIPLEDQLLMMLMKLKLNLRDLDLAERFGTSRTTVANVVKTLIYAVHELLFVGVMAVSIPSRAKCQTSMPKAFKHFPNTRLIMDATEITLDVPNNLSMQSLTYSHYKSRHTLKAVISVAPNGTIVHCTDLYPGSTSDVAIVEHSNVSDQCEPGDLILADKGFTINKLLPPGVSLNIPPFLRNKSKFTKEEAIICGKIAAARIHIERANERIKNFDILSHVPINMRQLSSKIIQVCCCLVNLQAPLIAETAKDYDCSV